MSCGCEDLVGVLRYSLLLFWGTRTGCRDCVPLWAGKSWAGWGWWAIEVGVVWECF